MYIAGARTAAATCLPMYVAYIYMYTYIHIGGDVHTEYLRSSGSVLIVDSLAPFTTAS